jgi:hypothetical protein
MNEMRRKIERDARIAVAAEELARAAQAVLDRPAAGQSPDSVALDALSSALARYREACG